MQEEEKLTTPGELTEKVPEQDNGYFGRPEVYDYKDVELGSGFEYDEKLLEDFNNLAAKYNLSQKGADELMTMAVRLTKQTKDNLEKAISNTTQSQIQSYRDMLENDKEIGGQNLETSLKVANLAYEQFAPEEVQTLLAQSGLNYHPQIVKMFMNIGRHMQNDFIYPSMAPQPFKEAREDILFPSMQ